MMKKSVAEYLYYRGVFATRRWWCAGTSAGFWLGGSMPPCRLRGTKFRKFDYEMVHSEV